MEGYKTTVTESSKELTKREQVLFKTGADYQNIEKDMLICPDYYVNLHIENPKSSDKEYDKFIIVDKDGQSYATGSASFISTFKDIFSDMEGEDFAIKVLEKESKNRAGKTFFTCCLI